MLVLDSNEEAIFYDVDGTLIHHGVAKGIKITDPYTKERMVVSVDEGHVKLLKRHFSMGKVTIVWSHGGVQWAKAVIEALELQDYVHAIIPKLNVYVDDNDFSPEGMQLIRIYLANGWGKPVKKERN